MARIEGDKEARVDAARKLSDDPPADARDELIAALRDRARLVRRYAAEALGKLGDAAAGPALVEALEDDEEDPVCREAAATALGQLGDERAIPHLACQLHGASASIGQAAANALAAIGTGDARRALEATLEHAERRTEAAQALSDLGHVPAAQAERLRYLIAHKDDAVVKEGRAALEPLVAELDRHDTWAPWAALMIEHVLAAMREELPDADLADLAALTDRSYTSSHYDAYIDGEREQTMHIDCAAIRRLANEEIDRREKAAAG
jgi:hypothetical protein